MLQTIKTLFLGGVLFCCSFSLQGMDAFLNCSRDTLRRIVCYLGDPEKLFLYHEVDGKAEHTVESLQNIVPKIMTYEKNKTKDFCSLLCTCKNQRDVLGYTSKYKQTVACFVVSEFFRLKENMGKLLSMEFTHRGKAMGHFFKLQDLSGFDCKGLLFFLHYINHSNTLSERDSVIESRSTSEKSPITSEDFKKLISPQVLIVKANEPVLYKALWWITKYSNEIYLHKPNKENNFTVTARISDREDTSVVPLSLVIDIIEYYNC